MKVWNLFWILLFLGTAQADDQDGNCTPSPGPENPGGELLPVVKLLHDPCMKEYQSLFTGKSPVRDSAVAGLKVRGTNEELSAIKRMLDSTRSVSGQFDRVPSKWNKNLEADCLKKNPDAKSSTVICMLAGLAGSEKAATQAMSIIPKTGFAVNFSQAAENPKLPMPEQLWSAEEIDSIYNAMNLLPKSLITESISSPASKGGGLGLIQKPDFFRTPDGFTLRQNAAAFAHSMFIGNSASGSIVLQETAFLMNGKEKWGKTEVVRTILHEIGHLWAADFGVEKRIKNSKDDSYDSTPELKAAGFGAPPYISAYAGTNTEEDFAESLSFYLLQPSATRTFSPGKSRGIEKLVLTDQKNIIPFRMPEAGFAPGTPLPSTDDLVVDCLQHLRTINPNGVYNGKKVCEISESVPGSNSYITMPGFDSFVFYTHCFDSQKETLGKSLPLDAPPCGLDAGFETKRYIQDRAIGTMRQIMDLLMAGKKPEEIPVSEAIRTELKEHLKK